MIQRLGDAIVVYMDRKFRPVKNPRDAELIKIIHLDGRVEFAYPQQP